MPHVEVATGRIISSQMGIFGKEELPYGYITLETPEGHHMTLKVDAYTVYETLNVGDYVRVDVHSLVNTRILVAREIVSATPFVRASTAKART